MSSAEAVLSAKDQEPRDENGNYCHIAEELTIAEATQRVHEPVSLDIPHPLDNGIYPHELEFINREDQVVNRLGEVVTAKAVEIDIPTPVC